jgi:hypothetical protein
MLDYTKMDDGMEDEKKTGEGVEGEEVGEEVGEDEDEDDNAAEVV